MGEIMNKINLKIIALALGLTLSLNTYAADYVIEFQPAPNSVSDAEVSSLSTSKISGFLSEVSSAIQSAISGLLSRSEIPSCSAGQFLSKVDNDLVCVTRQAAFARYVVDYGQNITHNMSVRLNANLKRFDSHNAVTTGLNTWRYTAPFEGYFTFTVSALFDGTVAWTQNQRYALSVVSYDGTTNDVVDSTILGYKRMEASITSNVGPANGSSTTHYLKQGDYVVVYIEHNRAAPAPLINSQQYNYIEVRGSN